MNPAISAIIMAFNEVDTLEPVVNEIRSTLNGLNQSYEIIIVDDGSSDGSGALADKLTKEFSGVKVIHHGSNKGLGGVYRTGFLYSEGNFITFFPADGQFPASIIEQFIRLMDGADMVLGYLPEGNRGLLSSCFSGLERWLFRLLFGPLPRFQGVMMFKRALLEGLKLKFENRGWGAVMELIIRARRNSYRIKSIPTEYRPRMHGRSKVNNLFTIWENLRQAIILRCNLGGEI